MSQQSLKKAAEKLEPVKRYLGACWNSPKRSHVFCLVEGEFDKHIYETRLNQKEIEVKIAADDSLHYNRSSVQYLVEDLRRKYPKGRFIGIRDKDYMAFLDQDSPEGIYVTDKRDLEMMILASSSFQASDSNIESYLETAFEYCVPMAYIRIYAENRELHKKLNDRMNITIVYNQQTKQFVSNAEVTLRKRYFDKVDMESNEEQLQNYVDSMNLQQISPFDICRGHDVVGLMGFVYGKSYLQDAMEEKMETYYSKEDFYGTSLFASVQMYCRDFDIVANA